MTKAKQPRFVPSEDDPPETSWTVEELLVQHAALAVEYAHLYEEHERLKMAYALQGRQMGQLRAAHISARARRVTDRST